MNYILFLHREHYQNVKWYTDFHVKATPQIYTQMLCNGMYLSKYKRTFLHKKLYKATGSLSIEKRQERKALRKQWKRETGLYAPTNVKTVGMDWLMESNKNWEYMMQLTNAVMKEHRYRFDKSNKSEPMFNKIKSTTYAVRLPRKPMTDLPITFSHTTHHDCIFLDLPAEYSYRAFYKKTALKTNQYGHEAKWTSRDVPPFMKNLFV